MLPLSENVCAQEEAQRCAPHPRVWRSPGAALGRGRLCALPVSAAHGAGSRARQRIASLYTYLLDHRTTSLSLSLFLNDYIPKKRKKDAEERTQSSVEDMDCCPAPAEEEAARTRELSRLPAAAASATRSPSSRGLTVWVTALRFLGKDHQGRSCICVACVTVSPGHTSCCPLLTAVMKLDREPLSFCRSGPQAPERVTGRAMDKAETRGSRALTPPGAPRPGRRAPALRRVPT